MSSGGTGLQLAARRQPEVFVDRTLAGPLKMGGSDGLHSYQRLPQQPHRHQHHQQPLQPRQQPQQQQHQHQQLIQQQSQQPPAEAAATNTSTNRLAAVQSKRKEKARIAARARRSQEASIIMEMAGELCISQEKLRRIDKATIVKLAIDYIRAHGVLCNNAPARPLCSHPKQLKNSHNNHINEQRQQQPQLIHQSHYNYVDEFDDQQQQQRPAADEEEEEDADADDEQQQQQLLLQQTGAAVVEAAAPLESEPATLPPEQPQQPLYSAPKLSTTSIFAPRTVDNMNPHFLMIEEKDNGKGAFVLKPDTEILDEDDLTHLAPQAGDISISLEVEPLEGIAWEDLLIPSPTSVQQQLWMR